jgi:predicted DNA-binding transcriptional regulator AlpA
MSGRQMPSRRRPSRQSPKLGSVKFPVVGAAEIAEMLGGLSRQRVSQLTAAKDFPAPLARLAMGSVWRFEDVREWAERTGRKVHRISAR